MLGDGDDEGVLMVVMVVMVLTNWLCVFFEFGIVV